MIILFVLGIGQAGVLIPTLPAMKEAACGGPNVTMNPQQTEAVVTLFNIFQQGGLIFGPVVGAFINKWFGFSMASFLGAFMCIGYGLFCLGARSCCPKRAIPEGEKRGIRLEEGDLEHGIAVKAGRRKSGGSDMRSVGSRLSDRNSVILTPGKMLYTPS